MLPLMKQTGKGEVNPVFSGNVQTGWNEVTDYFVLLLLLVFKTVVTII